MHSILNMSDINSQGTKNLGSNSPKSQERNSTETDPLLLPEGNNISVDVLDEDVSTPNNNFDYNSPSDFLETWLDENAFNHRRYYDEAWSQSHGLFGKEVEVGEGQDKIKWKVVPGVFDDDMKQIIEKHVNLW